MRTIQSVESEMKSLIDNRSQYKPRELSAAKKRMQFLNTCKMYLSDMPSQEFLVKERNRIELRMKLIGDGYDYWKIFRPRKNMIDDYNKEMGVDVLMEQLKTIKYLLNE